MPKKKRVKLKINSVIKFKQLLKKNHKNKNKGESHDNGLSNLIITLQIIEAVIKNSAK